MSASVVPDFVRLRRPSHAPSTRAQGDERAASAKSAAAIGPWLDRARAAGTSVRALEELGLMLHLYAGFPATIEFLRALRAWQGNATAARAAARPSPVPSPSRVPARTQRAWRAKGEELCERVYGPEYEPLRAFTRRLHPEIDTWMIVDGYGKTLSRPGLGVLDRELATVAALATLGWPRQLAAHRAGAMRVGASARAVREAESLGRRAGAIPRARAERPARRRA